MNSNKNGQAWGFDLMIASIIFITGIVSFYIYTLNASEEAETILNKLEYEGDIITNSLLLEGSPKNWTPANVLVPGIISNNKINQTKIDLFYNLTKFDYIKTKSLLNVKHDFYIYFSRNITANGEEIAGFGKLPESPKNLVKIERIVIYNNKPIILNLEIWE